MVMVIGSSGIVIVYNSKGPYNLNGNFNCNDNFNGNSSIFIILLYW